jgi:hypothetical protein
MITGVATLLLLFGLQVLPVQAADQQSERRGGRSSAVERLHRLEQRIATSGRTAAKAQNFRVLGHSRLTGRAAHGDVFFYDYGGDVGKYAYVGSWSAPCSGTGVKVVDVNK